MYGNPPELLLQGAAWNTLIQSTPEAAATMQGASALLPELVSLRVSNEESEELTRKM